MENAQALLGVRQQGRLLKLDTPLGADILLPHRVVAHDRLGRGYTYTLDVLSLQSDIELKQLIAQPVTLWVQQADKRSYLPVHGYVHQAGMLGHDGQFTVYQLAFSSWLHFLQYRQDARIWQDKTAEDIISDVFGQHTQARGNFRFDLTQPAPSRSYCTQYESDWNFVMRLMEEEGWYSYHEQKEDGSAHTLVITDSVRQLKPLAPQEIRFHRAGSNDEIDKITRWGGQRKLLSRQLSTVTYDYKSPSNNKATNTYTLDGHGAVPNQLEVYEYTGNYTYLERDRGDKLAKIKVEAWESQAKRYFAWSSVSRLAAGVGRWFSLADHTDHDRDSDEDRQFIVIGLHWYIENNLPLSTTVNHFPGSLEQQLAEAKQQTAASDKITNEQSGYSVNSIEVQRRAVEYRSPLEHRKPEMHAQIATVVGPESEEIYTDSLNRVKVRFPWNRLNQGDEKASCWVRVSYPNAGQGYGALNVPRIKQEVVITFLGGDPDRPLVTGRVYNSEQTPDWHTDGKLSGYKSKEYKGSGFTQLVMDDNTSQNRVQLYSSNTNAQLNLGYLVGQQGNTRQAFYGSGFALNSDAYGAITTNKGLYISTFGRPGAQGSQLDVREAYEQLGAGQNLTKSLSDTSSKANAEALDGQDSLKKFTDATQDKYEGEGQQQANRFKEPVLLAASPAGIGLTTPKSTHIHSGENVTLSSGTDVNLAVGKNLVASVANKISLFVQNAGIKMFAAKGKVEIQAQSDDLDIIAEKVLRLISTTDNIEIWAKKEITIGAGGSAIKINESGITDITSGQRIIHQSDFSLTGPSTLSQHMNTLPKSKFDEEFVARHRGSGKAMANRRFEITREDGSVLRGATDAEGKTGIQKSQLMGNIHLKFLDGIPK
ncbi:type VI secretion system Vgr family protein [Collimonas pratensis]|uniref:Rhs element Vgr family protein n=1 Tax=Collimonas pratensis TaxID=279113 RepID=A0ABN4M407_9BURK|nr:type VI secretion system Vgr family protein [Collimonas pratensis]AMP12841.1 rhs element Vgr family protein [Collimonas pratensis]